MAESPVASPAPPDALPEDVLSPTQWKTLLAVADAIVPSVAPRSRGHKNKQFLLSDKEYDATLAEIIATGTDPELAKAYLSESAARLPGMKEAIAGTLTNVIPISQLNEIRLLLTVLDTRVLTAVLSQRVSAFRTLPLKARVDVLDGWKESLLPNLREAQKALTILVTRTWLSLSPTLLRVIDFPNVPVNYRPPGPETGFPFEFLRLPADDAPAVIETDVVIVGSGFGGGMTAKKLAEAGHRVVVVEKGYHWPPQHFPMHINDGARHLFANRGAELSDDSSMAIVSGETWGGGGTINWSACLPPPAPVRRAWADRGLPYFTSAAWQSNIDRVWEQMGAGDAQIVHNHANTVNLEGARRLGYSARPVPQNTGGATHHCGHCTMGCHTCEKRGPAVSYLPDAARAGAQFFEGFYAERLIFDGRGSQRRVAGITGLWTSRDEHGGRGGPPLVRRRVVLKARKVVVAGGALRSPPLLLRSGLKNPQIGRNLYLHPVLIIDAVFDNATNPWEGGILTSVCCDFDNLDGQGHGARIEIISMMPNMQLPLFPSQDPISFRRFAAKYNHVAGFIVIGRDRDTGRVFLDPTDPSRARIDYSPSAFDRANLYRTSFACVEIAYTMGAREIHFSSRDLPVLVKPADQTDPPSINDPCLRNWVKEATKVGANSGRTGPLRPDQSYFASAHQMGSCRMGPDPKGSVVDPRGQVWGVKGLYVADSSVFPTATGVNPMITVLAMADYISDEIAVEMEKERGARL